jgi:SEC-C motif-containing protein
MNCPCGSEKPFTECCGPYLAGEPAPTPEALMRSRYTAYVHHEIDYLMATQAPEMRKDVDREATERWSREATWLGLKIIEVKGGGPGDDEGEVEFVARWKQGQDEATHHERSTFRRGKDGRWLYVEGHTPKRAPMRREAAPRPNDPCHCGSGKKYKRCHGL